MPPRLVLFVLATAVVAACAAAGSPATMAPITGYRLPSPPACSGRRYIQAKNPSDYEVTITLIGADGLMRDLAPAILPNQTRRYGLGPRDSVVTIRAEGVSMTGHKFEVNVAPSWGCDTTTARRPD